MVSTVDLGKLKLEDFSPHLDAVFELHSADGVVPLKLAKTGADGQATREGGAFSLLFVGPAGPWLPQAIYPVKHPVLGTMEIFLVPTGPTQGGNGYNAVFT
jgi:hypothetical protein